MSELAPQRRQCRGLDGWEFDVLDFAAAGDERGVVLCLHAMMVDRRTFWREGRASLVDVLVGEGLRVLVPDLRGHGESGPTVSEGGVWNYDELVDDIGTFVDLAAEISGGDTPVSIVGHSLGGHATLAYLGKAPDPRVRRLVLLGANIWGGPWEPRRLRLALKRAGTRLSDLLMRPFGKMPVRSMRMGTTDESFEYWKDLRRFILKGRWESRDGLDYYAGMGSIEAEVLQVISAGDKLLGRPEDGISFLEPLGDRRTVLHLGTPEAPGALANLRPDHMQMVTRAQSAPLWEEIARWLVRGAGGS